MRKRCYQIFFRIKSICWKSYTWEIIWKISSTDFYWPWLSFLGLWMDMVSHFLLKFWAPQIKGCEGYHYLNIRAIPNSKNENIWDQVGTTRWCGWGMHCNTFILLAMHYSLNGISLFHFVNHTGIEISNKRFNVNNSPGMTFQNFLKYLVKMWCLSDYRFNWEQTIGCKVTQQLWLSKK